MIKTTDQKTGEELICSIREDTTIEEFEILFAQLCNHVSWFKAEQNLTDEELDTLLSHIWKAIHDRIGGLRDPDLVKCRFEKAFENLRRVGGPPTIQ